MRPPPREYVAAIVTHHRALHRKLAYLRARLKHYRVLVNFDRWRAQNLERQGELLERIERYEERYPWLT